MEVGAEQNGELVCEPSSPFREDSCTSKKEWHFACEAREEDKERSIRMRCYEMRMFVFGCSLRGHVQS